MPRRMEPELKSRDAGSAAEPGRRAARAELNACLNEVSGFAGKSFTQGLSGVKIFCLLTKLISNHYAFFTLDIKIFLQNQRTIWFA